MNIVRLGPADIEILAAILRDHLDHDTGDLLMAYDPLDEAIKVKDGIWSPPLGKPVTA